VECWHACSVKHCPWMYCHDLPLSKADEYWKFCPAHAFEKATKINQGIYRDKSRKVPEVSQAGRESDVQEIRTNVYADVGGVQQLLEMAHQTWQETSEVVSEYY
jgi:hypothetical protein